MDLKESVFIVTGGSSGIGRATAKLLIQKGARVSITGRSESKLNDTASEIGAFPIHADVSVPSAAQITVDKTLEVFGKLDGLINNAGHGWSKPMHEATLKDFEEIYSVNVFGAAMMGKAVAEIFIKQNHGNIVNVASTAALKGYANGSIYSSSKFALRGLTQAWQAELRHYNVRVIGVNPSEVTTAFGQQSREERHEVANKLRSEEIAHAIVAALEMDDRGYIPELSIHATNPF